ncbi:MAG: hypothetical protein M1819_005787 [Sarea resinae]|nr:MAG: hypothetical protein M1819_005787 [Sarea resinae]
MQSGYGITYSPYNSDGSCKSQDQVTADFEQITGYSSVRIYGTDCDQVSNVLAASQAKDMKLFTGVYDITQLESELNTIISACSGSWSTVDTIGIGNELVNAGTASSADVVNAVNTARAILRAAGYAGPVVTVDTFDALINNPELCLASDYAAANCHAFFASDVSASEAGAYVLSQAQQVSLACNRKHTVITESGWPKEGQTNGAAIPSVENQQAAIDSLRENFSSSLVLFNAFDDDWKQPGAFDAEQHWGMLN